METKVALLIVYNHRYDKNISRLEEIYKQKFSHRFHIIPFYDGKYEIDGDIVPVVGHSWYFQGYLCQAYQYIRLKYGDDFFTHYFVVADDMLINPKLDENNLWSEMGIDKQDDFFPEFLELQTLKLSWRIHQALDYKRNIPGVEIKGELPSKDDALERFKKHNISCDRIPLSSIFNLKFKLRPMMVNIIRNKHWKYIFSMRRLDYPLVGGYSDTFLVTNNSIERFMHYCAAFASTGLFVEIAIPTALVLVSDRIKKFEDIKMRSGAIWYKNENDKLNKYEFILQSLINDFPEDVLFLHPIKLSKWK